MLTISHLIAYRYIYQINKIKNISTFIKISFFSIFFGSFALALAISIMSGFEKQTYQKMQNIYPQITIESQNGLNYELIAKIIKEEFPEIQAFAPSDTQFAIIQQISNDISNLIAVKGIDPLNENKVNNLSSKIIKKVNFPFEGILEKKQILIGYHLAEKLNLDIGHEIAILIPNNFNQNKINFKCKKVFIGGIFKTGIEEFDDKVIFSSLHFLEKNFVNHSISSINIKLKDNVNEIKLIKKLRDRFKLNVYSWKDLYPELISSLKLEKYAVTLVFLLIAVFGCINIISLLYMIINYKKRDLIILKTLGLSNFQIRKIFLLIGLGITTFASLFGLSLAYFVGIILKKYPIIKLPDTYYASYLPIELDIQIFVLIFFAVIIISFISCIYSLRSIIQNNISNELKNET